MKVRLDAQQSIPGSVGKEAPDNHVLAGLSTRDWAPNLMLMYESLTPALGGAPIVLSRLLSDYPGRVSLLSSGHFPPIAGTGAVATWYGARRAPWMSPSGRVGRRVAPFINMLVLPLIERAAVRLGEDRRDAAILASPFGGGEFFMAAYRASRALSVPLLTYVMDDWVWGARRHSLVHAYVAPRVFPRILERSALVWVISEFMAEQLASQYGVTAQVLPPAVDVDRYQAAKRVSDAGAARDEISLVYAGGVYGAQADAIVNVVKALQGAAWKVAGRSVRLTIYTHASPLWLRRMGLADPHIVSRAARLEDMPTLLANADVLLLPYSFDVRWRAITSTSLPTKTADYLASGVPVLVHGPSWSTIVRYARAQGFGLVVDKPDPSVLIQALQGILSDQASAGCLSARALATARQFHDLSTARRRFLDAIRTVVGTETGTPEVQQGAASSARML